MKKVILFTLLTAFVYGITASLVVVECTFPCLESNEHVCEVNDNYVRCKKRTNNTRWILKDSISLPEYQEASVELGKTCLTAPHPSLRDGSHISTNSSETIMEWPPQSDTFKYDSVYSNCGEALYCDKANICVKQFPHGQVCESDNQCFQGVCQQNTCITNSGKNTKGRKGLNTIHIIVTVVGIVMFLGLVIGIYLFKRRKGQKSVTMATKIIPFDSRTNSMTHTNSNNSGSIHHTVTNILQPDYESTFSPSRQQQELQIQLARQYEGQQKLPPPPYSP